MKNLLKAFILSPLICLASPNLPTIKGDTLEPLEGPRNYNLDEIKDNFLYNDYTIVTGDSEENYHKYLHLATQDDRWQQAQYLLTKTRISLSYPDRFKDKQPSDFFRASPDWLKGLHYLGLYVVDSDNPVAAYEGLTIIANIIMPFFPDKTKDEDFNKKVLQKYTPIFLKTLESKGFCYASYLGLRYEWYYGDERYDAMAKYKDSIKKCKDQLEEKKIPYWVDEQFRTLFYKVKFLTEKRKK